MRDWPRDKAEQGAVITAVARAVKRGDLVKPKECSWCGATDQPIEGHHPDYDRPLMVVWICRRCHKAHHREYAIERRLFEEVVFTD